MKIALVAPSYNVPNIALKKNKDLLNLTDYEIFISKKKSEIYNGPIGLRYNNFISSLAYPLIWSARGGEGAHHIAFQLKNKKTKGLLVGYSDFTYFHLWANLHSNMPSLHAPMWSEQIGKHQVKVFEDLFKKAFVRPQSLVIKPAQKVKGKIKGTLIGGNLTIICSCIGTWMLDKIPKGSILFIEDIDEDLHKIDRMLGHLRVCKVLEKFSAVVTGPFVGLNEKGYIHQWSLREVLKRNLGSIPFYLDFEVGHFHGSRIVPLGVQAEIEKNKINISGLHFKSGRWLEI